MALFTCYESKLGSLKVKVGDGVFASDTNRHYFAARGADGKPVLVDLNALLNSSAVAVGPCGVPGARGEKGDRGERGERGDRGTQGARGDIGPAGKDGKCGLDGERGKPGAKGERGEKGDRGDKGEQGARGEKGERGDITIVGDQELQTAVAKLKAQKAAGIAKILEVLNRRADSPTMSIVRGHLAQVRKALES